MMSSKWIPSSIDDHYDTKLVEFVKSHNFNELPNLLFYGSPGTGKTEFSNLLATHYLSEDISLNLFEYNASMDRGIDVVRNEIRDVSKNSSINGRRNIILLDEADFLTMDAQAALRRIIDTSPALFILTANYEHKLIPALRNRLSEWRFIGPTKEWIKGHFKDSNIDESILDKALKVSGSSFRDLYNNYDKISNGNDVAEQSLDLLKISSKDFIDMSWKITDPTVLIKDLHEQILKCNSKNKAKALIELADVDYKCSLSTNKYLQLQTGYIKIRNILKD